MYTIFINDNPIYLTDQFKENDENYFYEYDKIKIKDLINKIEKESLNSVYFYHANLDYMWTDFKNKFKIIEAAGGVVYNEKDELLWIYRNEKWDLPKGKIEKGEKKEKAAIREVQEECGIEELNLNEFISTTYHMYKFKGDLVLKFTYWYKMLSNSKQQLIPQKEEGITKVEWISNDKSVENLDNTYQNIYLLLSNLLNFKK